MFVFGVPAIVDESPVSGLSDWGAASVMYDNSSGGSPVHDGDPIGRWVAADLVTELSQTTSGLRPVADLDLFPGRNGMLATADQNLSGTLPLEPRYLLIILRGLLGGSRTVLTRDTTATTTKPQIELIIEEYST
jgi:hypothetical protein